MPHLFPSNTVRTPRKRRAAGIEAGLQRFESLSHAQYLAAPGTPETKAVFGEITRFLNAHLAR